LHKASHRRAIHVADPPAIAMLNACAYVQQSAQPERPERPALWALTVLTVQPPIGQSRASSSWSRAALSLLAARRRRTYLL
jgi:hypothetical protein